MGDDAPMVLGDEEKIGELQGNLGRLEVGSIGIEVDRKGVFHGEQKAVADGDRWQ
jgi:hypothetical protein